MKSVFITYAIMLTIFKYQVERTSERINEKVREIIHLKKQFLRISGSGMRKRINGCKAPWVLYTTKCLRNWKKNGKLRAQEISSNASPDKS